MEEFMALLGTASRITALRSYITCDKISNLSDTTTSTGNLHSAQLAHPVEVTEQHTLLPLALLNDETAAR